MQSGENVQALHKHIELIRFTSVLVLLLHFYCCCLPAFTTWGLSNPWVIRLLYNLIRGLPVLSGITLPKIVALALLLLSLFGSKGKKNEKAQLPPYLYTVVIGMLLYFFVQYIQFVFFSPGCLQIILYIGILRKKLQRLARKC